MSRTILFLTCLIFAIVVTLRSIGADGPPAEKKPASSLDRLQVGQQVSLSDLNGRYEIGAFPPQFHPLDHTVIEVGRDYVVLRDLANITDTVIPIYSIKAIKVMRFPGK